ESYLKLMKMTCDSYDVEILSYCLMPNHVHLIAVPKIKETLSKAIGSAHESYTRYINFKMNWRGYLWQGRFSSFPMDEIYFVRAARYIELNPVKAGIVRQPEDYPWSSARSRIFQTNNHLVQSFDKLPIGLDWRQFLLEETTEMDDEQISLHERTGRPLGSQG